MCLQFNTYIGGGRGGFDGGRGGGGGGRGGGPRGPKHMGELDHVRQLLRDVTLSDNRINEVLHPRDLSERKVTDPTAFNEQWRLNGRVSLLMPFLM